MDRNGGYCAYGIGWGKADSKGIEDGVHCSKYGKECDMQCQKDGIVKDVDVRLARMSDEHIEELAKGVVGDQRNELAREIASIHIATVLRGYIRLRKHVKQFAEVIGKVTTESALSGLLKTIGAADEPKEEKVESKGTCHCGIERCPLSSMKFGDGPYCEYLGKDCKNDAGAWLPCEIYNEAMEQK